MKTAGIFPFHNFVDCQERGERERERKRIIREKEKKKNTPEENYDPCMQY